MLQLFVQLIQDRQKDSAQCRNTPQKHTDSIIENDSNELSV
jgi:hypothetical protein